MRSDEKIDLHSFLNTHYATLILCYGIFVGKIPRNRAIKYFFALWKILSNLSLTYGKKLFTPDAKDLLCKMPCSLENISIHPKIIKHSGKWA